MTTPLTLNQIKTNFNNAISAQNPNINPTVKGTDWDVYGTAASAIVSGVYQDMQNVSNGAFIQLASGLYLDYAAFSLGQTPRRGATYATVIATIPATPSGVLIFPVNTIFTTTFNNQTYQLISTVTTSLSNPVTASFQCQLTGIGLSLPTGAVLTNSLYSTVSATVTSSTDGQGAETDGQLRSRLLYTCQNPQGGGRTGQYVSWTLESDSNVTGAIVAFPMLPGGLEIGVFVMSGGEDYDNFLTSNTPYNRTATPAIVLNSLIYINALRPVDASVSVASVALFEPGELTSPQTYNIDVTVSLTPGLTLSSLVTNINGAQITIENLILQELRRGFITYPFQGTDVSGSNYILISRLEQVLDVSLSVNGGIYQQILVDRTITILNGVTPLTIGIPVPMKEVDSEGNLICVYDLITDNGAGSVPVSGIPTPTVTLAT